MNLKASVLEAMQRGGSIAAIYMRLKREGVVTTLKTVKQLYYEIESDNREDVEHGAAQPPVVQ